MTSKVTETRASDELRAARQAGEELRAAAREFVAAGCEAAMQALRPLSDGGEELRAAAQAVVDRWKPWGVAADPVMNRLRQALASSTPSPIAADGGETEGRAMSDKVPRKFATNPNESDPQVLWAEIAHLQGQIEGPDGFATWQDAALAERLKRRPLSDGGEELRAAAQTAITAALHVVTCGPAGPVVLFERLRDAAVLLRQALARTPSPTAARAISSRDVERALWRIKAIGGTPLITVTEALASSNPAAPASQEGAP